MKKLDYSTQINCHKSELIDAINNIDMDSVQFLSLAIAETLKSGNKVVVAGNGGSCSDAEHLTAELVGRFNMERRSLPCINLATPSSVITAIANDYGYGYVFSRQLESLLNEKDIFIGISTSGTSANILNCIEHCQRRDIFHILLTSNKCEHNYADYTFHANTKSTMIAQEIHGIIIHMICDIVDNIMFTTESKG